MDPNNAITITYVDDKLDPMISEYLGKIDKSSVNDYNIITKEVEFNANFNYEKLIESDSIKQSDIIIIDSRLFENCNTHGNKFTGEEFKLIIKECCPFIEVIVITQKEICEGCDTIKKYCVPMYKSKYESSETYYNNNLYPAIEKSIVAIKDYRSIAKILKDNNNIDELLVEKITNSVDRIYLYNDLKKEDITEIIKLFNELKSGFNG